MLEHVKIVISFFQVVSPLGSVLKMPMETWMPNVWAIMHVADPLFINLSDFLHLHCLRVFDSFYTTWLLDVFGAPAAAAALAGLYYCQHRWCQARPHQPTGHAHAKTGAENLFFAVFFLVYPRVSKDIFQLLDCHRLSRSESWLVADYSVDCETATFRAFWLLALVMVVLIPIGVPLLMLVKLARARSHGSDMQVRP